MPLLPPPYHRPRRVRNASYCESCNKMCSRVSTRAPDRVPIGTSASSTSSPCPRSSGHSAIPSPRSGPARQAVLPGFRFGLGVRRGPGAWRPSRPEGCMPRSLGRFHREVHPSARTHPSQAREESSRETRAAAIGLFLVRRVSRTDWGPFSRAVTGWNYCPDRTARWSPCSRRGFRSRNRRSGGRRGRTSTLENAARAQAMG